MDGVQFFFFVCVGVQIFFLCVGIQQVQLVEKKDPRVIHAKNTQKKNKGERNMHVQYTNTNRRQGFRACPCMHVHVHVPP